jgi:hypothetical protein
MAIGTPDGHEAVSTPGLVSWDVGNVDGARLVVEVDASGHRHVQLFAGDEREPAAVLVFTPEQASRLAVALSS